MNLKKIKIIACIGIFLLCFLAHFGYSTFPNSITAIFFPVNESIWEHMKMLFTSIILYGIVDYIIMKKTNIGFSNFFFSLFVSALISIPVFLIIYLPFYYKIGAKVFLNIIVLFISIVISQIVSYLILKRNGIKYINVISIVLIIIMFIVFGYLTYFPIKNEIFFDSMNEKYGLNIYRLILPIPSR